MDGSPSRGETIPIRLFLGGFDLTPTFRDVNKKFSTRYYLSLVLIDEGEPKQAPNQPPYPFHLPMLTPNTQTLADTSSSPRSSSSDKPPRWQTAQTGCRHQRKTGSPPCLLEGKRGSPRRGFRAKRVPGYYCMYDDHLFRVGRRPYVLCFLLAWFTAFGFPPGERGV